MIGAGYARHATYAVVPRNLVFPLPPEVTFEQGSFAVLAATALHALRRTATNFSENVAVVGLGVVGQLTAQLFQLAGQFVIGWDLVGKRIRLARLWGMHESCLVGKEDPAEKTLAFTGGSGLDAGVVAIPGEATEATRDLEWAMKVSSDGHRTGVITIVGRIHFDYNAETTNMVYRRASRTGPGHHDAAWEEGRIYPAVCMRWNTQTNVNLCLRLIASGGLKVDPLITRHLRLEECERTVAEIVEKPDEILAVVFQVR